MFNSADFILHYIELVYFAYVLFGIVLFIFDLRCRFREKWNEGDRKSKMDKEQMPMHGIHNIQIHKYSTSNVITVTSKQFANIKLLDLRTAPVDKFSNDFVLIILSICFHFGKINRN